MENAAGRPNGMIDALMADQVGGQEPTKPAKPRHMGFGEWLFLIG